MSNSLDITINDFGTICRTCLSRVDLKPLYEKCFPSVCLTEMLMSCTFVKFTEDDGLPEQICTNCIDQINQAFSFVKRCETTDTILRKCVEKFETELPNNSFEFQTVEPIIKAEEKIDIKLEIISPNIDRTVEEPVEDYEFVTVKQEEDDENYDDPADETNSDNSGSRPRCGFINSQIEEESSRDEDGPSSAKRKNKPSYYECKKCFEKFPDFKGLKKHREEVEHPPNANSCPVCNKMIGYRSLKRHMRTHTGVKPYCCEICGASFSQGGTLSRHKRLRHPEPNHPTYQCQTCNKSFKNLDSLRSHQRREKEGMIPLSTHGEKKFLCSVCGRGFVSENLLNSHSKIHTGERPYPCHVCGKVFNHLQYLKSHKLIHASEKPHVCSVCSKAFVQPRSLKNHMRMHTGERPFSCGICGKSFTAKESLTYHKRSHTDEKPSVCTVCNKAFLRPINLKLHMRIHAGDKPHTCGVCNKAFTHRPSLKRHMRLHTGEKPYSCEICGKRFYTNVALAYHKRSHTGEKPNVCSVCSKAFTQPNDLKYHMRIHTGEKPYSCEICNKAFTRPTHLKYHMRIHTGEPSNCCGVCKKVFTQPNSLKRHMIIHTRAEFAA